MQRKIHNQTLFVAALSVYFGLLIVGAPPQVLAQSLINQQDSVKAENEKAEREIFKRFGDQLKALAASGKLDSFDITFQADIIGETLANSRTNIVQGDKELAQFLEKFVTSSVAAKYFINPLSPSKISWQVKGDKTDLNSKLALQLDSKSKAQSAASSLNLGLLFLSESKKGILDADILKNFTIQNENDQVFIVTRLPRAGLDKLLKAN